MMQYLYLTRGKVPPILCIMFNDANKCKLDELATVRAGHPFRGAIENVDGTGVAVIQLKDCHHLSGVNWDSVFESEVEEKQSTPWLVDGDVLFASRGGRSYAVTFREPEVSHLHKYLVAPQFYIVRCSSKIVPEFLTWQLNSGPCQRFLERGSVGTATKSIPRKVLSETIVSVPSVSIQQKIVDVVNSLNLERTLLSNLIANGDKILETIAKDLARQQARDASRDAFDEEIKIETQK